MADVHAVYHLAATVGVRLVVENPVEAIRNNIDQTAALLEAVANHANLINTPASGNTAGNTNGTTKGNVEHAGKNVGSNAAGSVGENVGGNVGGVLVASSSEVYGMTDRIPMREDQTLELGPTTSPRWSYAHSKALDEHMALAYHQNGKARCVVARLFNTIGPRQIGNYGMVVPRFVQRAVAGLPLEIYGDGTQTRCFCDVRDTVEALIRLVETPACHGQVFNVGRAQPISITDLAKRIIARSNSRSTLAYVPYEQAYAQNFDDLMRRAPALEKLQTATGFSATISLDQTLDDLISLERTASTNQHQGAQSVVKPGAKSADRQAEVAARSASQPACNVNVNPGQAEISTNDVKPPRHSGKTGTSWSRSQ